MNKDVQVKICGMTREEDIRKALDLGARWIGMILFPKSPRCISLESATELLPLIPQGRRVAVDVAPSIERLKEYQAAGFDFFQIHFDVADAEEMVAAWSETVGKEHLWLAPKVKPGDAFPDYVLKYTDSFLIDTYSVQAYGGTGRTGDWDGFAKLQAAHPDKNWILAGGVNPENAQEAVRQSGTRRLDASSGLEASPGVKDHEKLAALFSSLKMLS